MGVFFWGAWGEKDTAICEEIAKLHKVELDIVIKHYKKMLEVIKDEIKD